MKKVILNIHGFNSGPGQKAKELLIQFSADVEILAPQLPYQPREAIRTLRTILDKYKGHEVHIVGTSLGAFYTMYLSTLYSDQMYFYFYIVNPSFTPFKTLSRYTGNTVRNYKTQEQFKVTDRFLEELKEVYEEILQRYSVQSLYSSSFFLSTQDEVLDFKQVLLFLKSFGVPYRLLYSQQDHRFQDISTVVQTIRENMVG